MLDLASTDATGQAELVRSGEVSPLELVDAAISRIERVDPQLNAVIIRRFEQARAEARSRELPDGPFRGVPFLLKDLHCTTKGDPIHEGMRFLKELGWVARADSYLAAKLRAAGFVFLGRTNTPELGLTVTTEPDAYGPSRNPWNPARSTGGSSGGSAAAVASGMVPAAHASDGGGSIRIPASECGLVGLKPSRGRVSAGPDAGDPGGGLPVQHAVTRTVRDSAAMLDVVSGPMPGDPYTAPLPRRPFHEEVGVDPGQLRVGVLARRPGAVRDLHPDCGSAARDTGDLLASLGHRVSEAHPAALDEAAEVRAKFMVAMSSWTAASLDDWSRITGKTIRETDVEVTTWAMAEIGRACSAPRYLEAREWLNAFARRVAGWWDEGFDLLVTPTIGGLPPRLGELTPDPANPMAVTERILALIPFTPTYNITGQPAISLPLAWSKTGLPIGVQLVAAYGREDVLIRAASQLEHARPWRDRQPPIFADASTGQRS